MPHHFGSRLIEPDKKDEAKEDDEMDGAMGGSSSSGVLRERDLGEPNDGGGKRVKIGGVTVKEAINEIEKWIDEIRAGWDQNETDENRWLEEAWDDVKGGELKVADVRRGREEEVTYMKNKGIWEVVPIEECWNETGKPPTGTRWVDTNKGTDDCPDVRCRLVARDFRKKGGTDKEDLFAATPPVEAERMALSRAVTRSKKPDVHWETRKVMLTDAKGALESEM